MPEVAKLTTYEANKLKAKSLGISVADLVRLRAYFKVADKAETVTYKDMIFTRDEIGVTVKYNKRVVKHRSPWSFDVRNYNGDIMEEHCSDVMTKRAALSKINELKSMDNVGAIYVYHENKTYAFNRGHRGRWNRLPLV